MHWRDQGHALTIQMPVSYRQSSAVAFLCVNHLEVNQPKAHGNMKSQANPMLALTRQQMLIWSKVSERVHLLVNLVRWKLIGLPLCMQRAKHLFLEWAITILTNAYQSWVELHHQIEEEGECKIDFMYYHFIKMHYKWKNKTIRIPEKLFDKVAERKFGIKIIHWQTLIFQTEIVFIG